MCRPGNQSILKSCRDVIIRASGKPGLPNQEMRRILKEHGGCMTK